MATLTSQPQSSKFWYTPEPLGFVAHRDRNRARLQVIQREPGKRPITRTKIAKAEPLTGRALLQAEIIGWNDTPCADFD